MKKQTIYALMILAMITWGMAWSSAKIVNNYLPYDELVFLSSSKTQFVCERDNLLPRVPNL